MTVNSDRRPMFRGKPLVIKKKSKEKKEERKQRDFFYSTRYQNVRFEKLVNAEVIDEGQHYIVNDVPYP